jgi:hypothetical protein
MKGAFGNEGALRFVCGNYPGLIRRYAGLRMQRMPTVLRIGPYRFHFYSRESNEPPHIHVARDDLEVKFWLNPISIAANFGLQRRR